MKLACASTICERSLSSGDLTQIEFLESAARDLCADGVVLDVRHFPRTDADYLAQIKKLAVDLGLCIAAVRDDDFFAASDAAMNATLDLALALGAPLLSAPLPRETAVSWTQILARLGLATSLAKRANVTIALRNALQTFAASTHDMKRVAKEADSAWLRYGPDVDAFEAGSEPAPLATKTVLLWGGVTASDGAVERICSAYPEFRGFVALDDRQGLSDTAVVRSAIARWRAAVRGGLAAK